ncbi:uncharacterized protein LOC132751613 isoform X2 [Ruditapes philippinarum]|uniref:uncharacterized protein LOC132751613 isoform X2 n=1 Tax=Ruditapes philippinarum TaxID=129788 RepID=UPI00295A83FC|nr:uncharacterized protein LOC132751613 isoform X2 [Ruditapes philippinarum]
MDHKVTFVFTLTAISLISFYVDCRNTIKYCDSYKDIYKAYHSCAIFSMYNTSSRNTMLFDKEVIYRQDLVELLNYWCSILDAASSCTSGKALRCNNRAEISMLVSKTGGACKNGHLNEEYQQRLPASFRYDTNCVSQAFDITERCEDETQNIGYSVDIVDGVKKMETTVEHLLKCNADSLRSSSNTCVSSEDSVLLLTLRALTFSVPHVLGVDLPISTVLEIVGL